MLRVSWALVKMKVLAYGTGESQRLKARLINGRLFPALKAPGYCQSPLRGVSPLAFRRWILCP
jgi:hypothetical protein